MPALQILLEFAARNPRNLRVLLESGFTEILSYLAKFYLDHIHDESLTEAKVAAQLRVVLKCFGIFYGIVWHESSKLTKSQDLVLLMMSTISAANSLLADGQGGEDGGPKVMRTPTPLAESWNPMGREDDFVEDIVDDSVEDEDELLSKESDGADSQHYDESTSLVRSVRALAIPILHLMCKSIAGSRRIFSRAKGAGDFLVSSLYHISATKGRNVDSVIARGVVLNAGTGHLTSCILDLLAMHMHMTHYCKVCFVQNLLFGSQPGELIHKIRLS